MKTKKKLLVSAVALLTVVGMTAACTPPDAGGGLPAYNWSFKGTQVKVIDSQDCTWDFINCEDEPYLLNIAFRVKIGVPNSAQVWVVSNSSAAPQNIAPGTPPLAVNDAAGGKVTFAGVQPVDLLDLANTNNHLEVFGTYTWASEQDIGADLSGAAGTVGNFIKDTLNGTLATGDISGLDAQGILNMILDSLFNNLGGAFVLGLLNIESWLGHGSTFGTFSDDALGGGVYVGIGAHGVLGSAIDGLLGGVTIPNIGIPAVDIPPDINGGGVYTMTGAKNFTQTFSGVDGVHQWWMTAGPA